MQRTKHIPKRGAHLKVCEYEINFCPYCGSQKLDEGKRPDPHSHLIICQRCLSIFITPCED